MKVRRKSEIAEAVQDVSGFWQLKQGGITWNISAQEFAAHYEPVPEPPARSTIKTGFETVEQIMASSVLIPAPYRATIAREVTIKPCACGHCGKSVTCP